MTGKQRCGRNTQSGVSGAGSIEENRAKRRSNGWSLAVGGAAGKSLGMVRGESVVWRHHTRQEAGTGAQGLPMPL